MTKRIPRRVLLANAVKAGAGVTFVTQAPSMLFGRQPNSSVGAAVSDVRYQTAFARLDEFIAAHLKDIGAPGMTVSLATRDGLLRASAHGFSDSKTGARVQPNTLFEIGSISKSFVALALLQMREERKFDPAKPITAYLPWLKVESKYAPITGHHLLSHTSGLPDGVPLELIGSDLPLWTGYAPGERFAYSNVGYDLLGQALEAIDQQPMATVLKRRVMEIGRAHV